MEETVPVRLPDGSRLFIRAEQLSPSMAADLDDEQEIAGRVPSIAQVASAVGGFSEQMGQALQRASPDRFSITFDCEFGFEAGGLVAVIGKASGKTAFRVVMEWDKTEPTEP
ncbi:hypothetical protein OG426_54705 (plasmid) [Streptomyces canus]|uniref:CU044_2847 family protein n=1 Tax=Streptomyces canus TaxID=58343 RepID=UPI002F90BD80|nr:hypothetical protein OG426_54705 [Streptomyces canus]